MTEMVNSLTNIAFELLALHHLYSAIMNKHSRVYIYTCIGFAVVGLGSFVFHMSLLYKYQLMDELPMIYVTAIPLGYLLGYDKSFFIKKLCHIGTVAVTLLFTYIYVYIWRNPVFHEAFYALVNLGLILKSLDAIHSLITDNKVRKLEYKLIGLALGFFALGFLIWNIDNLFCSPITLFRRNVLGLPLGFLTEGHGWWHIFTGMGIYYFILYNEILSTWIRGAEKEYKLIWYGPFAELRLKARPDIKTD
ncbi:hypothetical protein FOA43_003923 [Brettanomyces nanus]|uniref:Alkaline phytoceramidase n=1 Tax=Eeniella nana TaxID=13502 RepID=A0A875SCM8_EENNA|nr:uncharacterized protein FOA43_003923 [Brettanomyces nanus]QPG76534.1 hypothetical protein FOA43_003923 [Brettanomyces nanus]